jgi:hypothetical protein
MDKLLILLIFFCSSCDDANKSISQSNSRGFYEHCPPAQSMQMNAQPALDHLIITEISPLYAINRSIWFELYNPSTQPITLNKFQLRSQAIFNQQEPTVTSLPNVILEPNQYIVVMSVIPFQLEIQEVHLDSTRSENQAMHQEHGYHDDNLIKLTNSSSTFFWDNKAGFLELLDKETQITIDFVHFGSDLHQPRNTQQWQGDAITRYQHPNEATSLARHFPYRDSNQSHDWSLSTFNTPGGTNLTFPSTDDGQINLTLT